MAFPPDKVFPTSNTALAAWLHSQGFELLDTDLRDSDSVVFCFRDDSPALKEAIRLFQIGKAEGNIVIFYASYKKMLTKVKGAKL